MNTMLCRDNPAEAVRMYNELKERVTELEQALERIADMSVDIHGTIPPSIRIAREALGRG